jgi:hypothetical protein
MKTKTVHTGDSREDFDGKTLGSARNKLDELIAACGADAIIDIDSDYDYHILRTLTVEELEKERLAQEKAASAQRERRRQEYLQLKQEFEP